MAYGLGDDPFQPSPPDGYGGGVDPFVLAALIWLINTLVSVVQFFWNLIVHIVKVLVVLFQAIAKFLDHLWKNYVKRAIQWLASHVQKLRAWLKRTIGPIIKRLQKIKQWYDQHILKQQLRMLQMIQNLRRILGILRLFHVKWAAKLDGALADMQNRIETTIAVVRGTLNQIINTLAIAFDPTMLITRDVLGASLLSNLGAIKRIFGFGDNRILSATEKATIDKDHSRYFRSNVDAHVKTLTDTGPTVEDNSLRIEFRQSFAEATNTILPTQAP
jgi:hypothetical protein